MAITLIRERGKLPGRIEAPDEDAAIKAPIEQFNVTNPEQPRRLIARRKG